MNTYFERYAYPITLFKDAPAEDLKISIVIPCFNEPDLLRALNSLNNCTPIKSAEVIVIVNEPEECPDEIREQNIETIKITSEWGSNTTLNYKLHIYHLRASNKEAGVGMARKVGMDEAARRFEAIGRKNGVICCFDADSTCEANYLQEVSRNFLETNKPPIGASIYYQHTLPRDNNMKEGIIQYELHLRYYVQALRWINYPFAHQTIGSSMVVRADIYQKVGGMNKRKAGEDFYFLHRVMPMGNYLDITSTTIYPSPRVSTRVPFGTGKAMEKWQREHPGRLYTYNLASFHDLGEFLACNDQFFQVEGAQLAQVIKSLPESIKSYLRHISFKRSLKRINQQSNSVASFKKNWFLFFDGFKVLKYLHFARDYFYPNQPVVEQAKQLVTDLWPDSSVSKSGTLDILNFYRLKDKSI